MHPFQGCGEKSKIPVFTFLTFTKWKSRLYNETRWNIMYIQYMKKKKNAPLELNSASMCQQQMQEKLMNNERFKVQCHLEFRRRARQWCCMSSIPALEKRGRWLYKFKISLVSRVNFRTARTATQRNTVFKIKTKQKRISHKVNTQEQM